MAVTHRHHVNDEGEPLYMEDGSLSGGNSNAPGVSVRWQDGPEDTSGAVVEDVLEAARGRLEHIQSSRHASPQHAEALKHVAAAIGHLSQTNEAPSE